MRTTLLLLAVLLLAPAARAQLVSSRVEVVTVYSQNGRFYLKTVPFDNQEPSLRGRTSVYEAGNPAPLYVLERGFDFPGGDHNTLVLSDDGQVIFYAVPWRADEEREGLKSVTIYRAGRVARSYTLSEVTGCDLEKERCTLVYSNYEQVVDRGKSRWGTPAYRKVFREGVDVKERFLSDYAVFASDDTVYLTDSKKMTHLFDLGRAELVRSAPFDELFEGIKGKGRSNRVEVRDYDVPMYADFPPLKGGGDTALALARHLGMTAVPGGYEKGDRFKLYTLRVTANVARDGSVEIEKLEADEGLPKEKIVEFFSANRFDRGGLPAVFEKWNIDDEFFWFRKKDPRVAREERRLELLRQREEYQRRLTQESIEGVYIPKDLGECMAELDKNLSEIDRQEMRALPRREDMIRYHLGLGTWMRNNWGLWGGSRLQTYFVGKGVKHPESMSSVILYHYHDWLNGRRETWKEWERSPGRR